MTWTECAIWFLVAERCFAIAYGVVQGVCAAIASSPLSGRDYPPHPHEDCDETCEFCSPKPKGWRANATSKTVPDFVEVASDDVVALDYSSNHKRH